MELPQIVSMYIDAFCRQDLDACLATFAPDGTYNDPGTAQPLSGQALRDHFGGFFAGFPDATWSPRPTPSKVVTFTQTFHDVTQPSHDVNPLKSLAA